VVLSDEDFRRANVKATQTIDIQSFVPEGEIPVEYFESPYYLAPAARGQKVYALLRETLRSSKRIAVAQVVIRTTQHLAAIVVNGRALMLNTLRYEDELLGPKGLELPAEGVKAAGVTPKEVALAKRLIDDMTEHWKPGSSRIPITPTSWPGSSRRSSKGRPKRSPMNLRRRSRARRR
jgi:DNA end-binding protein Ku